MNKAIADVTAERLRQVQDEGWDAEHDDRHLDGGLPVAAACYAMRAGGFNDIAHDYWPWDDKFWKPKDARRDLVRAAALIIAEIERLDRLPSEARDEQP